MNEETYVPKENHKYNTRSKISNDNVTYTDAIEFSSSDEESDYEVVKWLVRSLGFYKSWKEYVEFMLDHPEKLVNLDLIRNAGYLKSLKNDTHE